jgi:hypothetical protein
VKTLFEAMKAALEGTGSFKSVFLTPLISEELVAFPRHMKLPAAGITLGREAEPEDRTAGGLVRFFIPKVAVYASFQASDPASGFIRALELADTVQQTLHRNLLGLDNYDLAHYGGVEASTVVEFPGAGQAVQVVQNFRYEQED